jgi:hypothetical protein
MESNQISKVAEIDLAKIFSIFLQAAKYAGEKAGHSPFDEYGEAKLAKYITIMINFILFIAGKQDDPVSRDLFSRLGLILFTLLMGIKQLNGTQRGGVRVIRNNLVMDVDELQPGDQILGDINAGAQFGNQIANYGNRLYDQAVIQQPPQVMEITADERRINVLQRQNEELQLRVLNENLNLQLEVQEGRRSLIKGEVSFAEMGNQAAVSMTAGSCCAIFMNVCTKVTINAGDNCSDVINQIFVNSNELCKKGVASIPKAGDILPEAIPAFGNFVWQVGAMADRNVKAGIEFITPQGVNNPNNMTSMGNSGNVSITDLMNEPDIDLTFEKQTDCFEMIWSNMSQRIEESKEIMGRTDVQCGICCCIGVYTVLNYAAYCRARRARQIIIEGAVGERITYENNQNALRVAQIAAGIGAVGAVATGVPLPTVAAGLAAVNNALAPQNNGIQPQPPNLVEVDPTATTGMRQRITNNANGGYKKTKRNNKKTKKTKKIKRNNKKTKKYRKSRKYKNKK